LNHLLFIQLFQANRQSSMILKYLAILPLLSALLCIALGILTISRNPRRPANLGFMLGMMAVMATTKPFNAANFIAPLLVIGLPLIDTKLTVLRRIVRGKPLFKGDRDHAYDLLLKMGWSQPKVWCVLCGVQAVLVGIGIIVYRL